MREKVRSEYGTRLVMARKHAGLTQHAVAKAVGMSQSAYAGAETTGQGSTYTSQLAAVCGVNAEWLATGDGDMLGSDALSAQQTPAEPDRIRGALRILADSLRSADRTTRTAVAPLLSLLASEPDQTENVVDMLEKLLPVARGSQQDGSGGKEITSLLPSLEQKEPTLHAKRISNQTRGRT